MIAPFHHPNSVNALSAKSYGNIYSHETVPDEFVINREKGVFCYTFIHFFDPVIIKTKDGVLTTKKNACIFYKPFECQYYRSTGTLTHTWFHFDEKTAGTCAISGIEFSKIYYIDDDCFVEDAIRDIENEYHADLPNRELCIDSKLDLFIINFSRYLNLNNNAMSNIPKEFLDIRTKMLEHLDDDWSIDKLADELHISNSYFQVKYKEYFGISPALDKINHKIYSAKRLLKYSNLSVSEIAYTLGYNNVCHFTRQFKKYAKTSPTDCRNSVKNPGKG